MIKFGTNENWRYDLRYEEVRFYVSMEDGRYIICRVTRECIEDNLGNPETQEDILDAAKTHFDKITDLVGHLIAAGKFEEDGSVLIRSRDWR